MAASPGSPAESLPILLIDADRSSATAMGERLSARGHPVRIVHTGGEGLEALRQTAAPLVLLDAALPDVPALEVVRQARTLAPPPDVVLLATDDRLEVAESLVRAGGAGYLVRPVEPARLGMVLDRLLELRRTRGPVAGAADSEGRHLHEALVLLILARAAASGHELRPLLPELARRAARAVGLERCVLFFWKGDRLEARIVSFADAHAAPMLWQAFKDLQRYRVEEMPAYAEVIRVGAPVVIEDVLGSDLIPYWWVDIFSLRSALLVPMAADGQRVGVLHFDNSSRRASIGPDQIRLATTLADGIARAVLAATP